MTIKDNPNIIQGLASISDYNDHFYLHLVESAPFNLGKNKLYEGVPENLFAFTCKQSWDKGYDKDKKMIREIIADYKKTGNYLRKQKRKLNVDAEELSKIQHSVSCIACSACGTILQVNSYKSLSSPFGHKA